MTESECVSRFKHQLWGVMLDVTRTGATGGARAALEDQAMRKIEAVIAAIWRENQPDGKVKPWATHAEAADAIR